MKTTDARCCGERLPVTVYAETTILDHIFYVTPILLRGRTGLVRVLKSRYTVTEPVSGCSVVLQERPFARSYKEAIRRAVVRVTEKCDGNADKLAFFIERNK